MWTTKGAGDDCSINRKESCVIVLIEIDKDRNKKIGSIYVLKKTSGVIVRREPGLD